MGRCGDILILQPPKTSLLRKVLVAWWHVDTCGPGIRPTGRQTPHHQTTVEVLRGLSWQEELLISFSVSPWFFVFFCYWIFHNQFNSSHLISILVCGINWHQTVSQFLSSNLENSRCLLLFSRSVVSDFLWPHGLHTAHQASLCIAISQSLLKLMSIELVMPPNHLILCHPLLLLPSIFPSIRVFSNELALCIRCRKYWSFSFSISPSSECSGLISFRMDWFDLLAVQGTLKSLLQFEWVFMSSSRGSCQPENWTQVFQIAGAFTIWATREAPVGA